VIAVIDYGAGNLRSVAKAIAHLGYACAVTHRPEDVLAADAVFLPGVGAAGDTMRSLEDLGLVEPIRRVCAEDKPFFGVCLGLQVLLTTSEEGGEQRCLGVIPGRVRQLPPGLKVPHMGWNNLEMRRSHPIFKGVPASAHFYFVHSYYGLPDDASMIVAETDYGLTFPSVIARGNLIATQFHPEKSGDWGLKLYDNFLTLAGIAKAAQAASRQA
jgi:glutamine amidotransferase